MLRSVRVCPSRGDALSAISARSAASAAARVCSALSSASCWSTSPTRPSMLDFTPRMSSLSSLMSRLQSSMSLVCSRSACSTNSALALPGRQMRAGSLPRPSCPLPPPPPPFAQGCAYQSSESSEDHSSELLSSPWRLFLDFDFADFMERRRPAPALAPAPPSAASPPPGVLASSWRSKGPRMISGSAATTSSKSAFCAAAFSMARRCMCRMASGMFSKALKISSRPIE
mmetsp:Transcript_35829/g.112417  ORF Transcript_35829/g.112417 Transcript_35829/m.112417 type:complete len:229 (-) Transcript_35829:4870-5556(-)